MQTIFSILTLSLILFIVHEVFRRGGKATAWLIFLVLPLGLTPYWIAVNDFGLFEWCKLLTILLTACWLVAIRFTKLYFQPCVAIGLTVLFGLNILEAVAVDLAVCRLASIMNATAGVLLVTMLPKSSSAIRRSERLADLEYKGLNRNWIVAFTLWNLTFLYLNYPTIFGHHLAVLGVPLLVGLYKPQLWLQARISLLTLDLMALATFGPILIPWLDTTSYRDLRLDLFAAGVTLIASLLCVLVQASSPRHAKRNPLLVNSVNA